MEGGEAELPLVTSSFFDVTRCGVQKGMTGVNIEVVNKYSNRPAVRKIGQWTKGRTKLFEYFGCGAEYCASKFEDSLSQAKRNESLETEAVKERDERVVFHTRVITDCVEQNE